MILEETASASYLNSLGSLKASGENRLRITYVAIAHLHSVSAALKQFYRILRGDQMNLGALAGKQSGRDLLLFRTPTQVNVKRLAVTWRRLREDHTPEGVARDGKLYGETR